MFTYDPTHKVVVCHLCATSLVPGRSSQERHLRATPHGLSGGALTATLAQLSSYDLRSITELRAYKPQAEEGCRVIAHLASYRGVSCLRPGCGYSTRHLPEMKQHWIKSHQTNAAARKKQEEQRKGRLWRECELQTYFTGKGLIDYFVVVEAGAGEGARPGPATAAIAAIAATATTAQALFTSLEYDTSAVQQDLEKAAAIVQNINASRSERVPWLEKTGFPAYLAGLQDRQIKGSYQLPPEDPAKAAAGDQDLVQVLAAARALLQGAYQLCSDTTSPDYKMTQQRADILAEFYTGAAAGTSASFRCKKDPSTLTDYFRVWQQLLTYYWRVVRSEEA